MNLIFLWAVTGGYAVQAAISAGHGNYPQALVIGAYALANLGLIWSWQ